MPSRTYSYFPPTGALPGKSFEKQTVDFFEGLQEQVDLMDAKIANLEKAPCCQRAFGNLLLMCAG